MDDPTTWPVAVYEPRDDPSLGATLRELWSYREVTWSFAMRRIRTRYKQTVFGLLWAVIQPLAFLGLFVAFVGRGDPGYAAGTFGALVGWQFVSSALSGGGTSLTTEAGLIRKVYFPRECVVLGSVGSFLPDFVINLLCLLVIGVFLDADYGWTWLLLLPLSVLIVFTALAVVLPLAALAVYFRDVVYTLPFLAQIWLFASPVAYGIDRVSGRWQWVYALANPAVGPITAFRDIVAFDRMPRGSLLLASGATTVVLLLAGYRWFKHLEREFVEVI